MEGVICKEIYVVENPLLFHQYVASGGRKVNMKTGKRESFHIVHHFMAAGAAVPVFAVLALVLERNVWKPNSVFWFFMLFLAGCHVCVLYFLLSLFLKYLRGYVRFPGWAPVVLAFPACLSLLLISLSGSGGDYPVSFFLIVTTSISVPFMCYWSVLMAAPGILRRVISMRKQ